MEITQAEKEFAANAAVIRAEGERGERFIDIIALAFKQSHILA